MSLEIADAVVMIQNTVFPVENFKKLPSGDRRLFAYYLTETVSFLTISYGHPLNPWGDYNSRMLSRHLSVDCYTR